ncbi:MULTISPECIES: AtpZ/AtpI family protein [Rhodopirellula]|uniref:ATP synthase protein 1 n=1 Tax=Rhodopirellula europaea 6C TaxID=1263867 RepID=M2B020_9BACT|nr:MULTISPECIES: AtpZ/AtpI family protein [Rhodopirellula]EMB18287.1 ATP synthase protein 1 [Rhodopirellula europaea 6C]|tara:strand:+ start:20168 stop:20452 length:285 start_codon:yes stop_codon:yes gene_type:complete
MNERQTLQKNVDAKQSRKLDARQQGDRSAWFGLGMFGLVGWSIAIPTLLGIALGIWIDERWPSRFSWTLMLLIGGVGIGCLNAWWWINRENEDE